VVLVLKMNGHVDFDLIFFAEALLVNDVAYETGSVLRVERGRDDDFVLGIGFFGGDGAREIQFAARPGGFFAETAHVADDSIDLFRGKRIGKAGHDLREAARGTAVDDHGFPGGVWFGSGLIALREIGEGAGRFESAEQFGSASAICAVTGDAGSFVNLFTGVELERGGAARLPG